MIGRFIMKARKTLHSHPVLSSLLLCVLLSGVIFGITYDIANVSGSTQNKTDLSLWVSGEYDDRVDLLPYLLGHDPEYKTTTEGINLSASSPILGLDQLAVIKLLGSPDKQKQNRLTYNLGNLTTNSITNKLVAQNATLQLYFEDEVCVKYDIWL